MTRHHGILRHKISSQSKIASSTTDDNLEEMVFPSPFLEREDVTSSEDDTENRLTAPVKLPTKEDMTVRLGPVNLIERIDEYQSDENLAFTLIGLFLGASLGIICDWSINNENKISNFSIILIAIFIGLSFATGIWLRRIISRKSKIRKKIS